MLSVLDGSGCEYADVAVGVAGFAIGVTGVALIAAGVSILVCGVTVGVARGGRNFSLLVIAVLVAGIAFLVAAPNGAASSPDGSWRRCRRSRVSRHCRCCGIGCSLVCSRLAVPVAVAGLPVMITSNTVCSSTLPQAVEGVVEASVAVVAAVVAADVPQCGWRSWHYGQNSCHCSWCTWDCKYINN